ncbi:MAG: 2-dehydropantoate 2-reductase, partial [Sporomusaceae bacterium]|nr:2-dehydropantoate 2-reductase [Sporomusaceae bacterium]
LNGVDIYERIRSTLSTGIVLPACVYVGTHIEKPGMVSQAGGDGMILFGKDPAYPDYYPAEVINLFNETKLNFKWYNDAYPAIWEKYMFIAAVGLVTAWTGKSFGAILQDEELKLQTRRIMSEIYALSEKKQIGLAADLVDASISKLNRFPFETKSSYQRDVEKGNLNEGTLFGETIIKMGKALSIPTPVTERVYFEIEQKLVK